MSTTALMLERGHVEMGLAPVADFFDSGAGGASDVISLKDHNRARAILLWGVGTTGTATLTVEACDDVTPTTHTAIPFWYRITVAAADPGAITLATASGFTTTAGSNQLVEIEINAAELNLLGRTYFRIVLTEVVDSPVLGGIVIELLEPRFATASSTTATT